MSRVALAALLLWAPAAMAEPPAPSEEVVEEVEHFEPVQEAGGQGGIGELVGYFHAAMVHMPIAWLLLLGLVDLASFARKKSELARLGFVLLAVTAASFVPAVLTGLARMQSMCMEPAAMAPALLHRNIMLACGGVVLAALALRWRKKNQLAGAGLYVYAALVAAATILVLVGGHMGGEMIFGDPPF